uniref:Alpha-ketoglutarate-dependent dioxygenase AlkB-like domain-containing protein n=1 Tax=Glossina austeni TaxID=7395 RepID=A0A1A9VCK6_GLOAU
MNNFLKLKTIFTKSVYLLQEEPLLKRIIKFVANERKCGTFATKVQHTSEDSYLEFLGNWPNEEKQCFLQDMRIFINFVNEDEEQQLLNEVEPYMKRLRYEYDHWDDAIHGFRETERKHWYPENRKIIDKIRNTGFADEIMPFVHVLDLSSEGVIKPHVDSTRYCGNIIAGLSLLTDSVMRLVRIDEEKYQQNDQSNVQQEYRTQPEQSHTLLASTFHANVLLPRRSLYIMSNTARYHFTHEILPNGVSTFRGQPVQKDRRISIICRNEP